MAEGLQAKIQRAIRILPHRIGLGNTGTKTVCTVETEHSLERTRATDRWPHSNIGVLISVGVQKPVRAVPPRRGAHTLHVKRQRLAFCNEFLLLIYGGGREAKVT